MTKVFKYPLNRGLNVVSLPLGAKVIHFGIQKGFFRLWAEVDPETQFVHTRKFLVIGTGRQIDEEHKISRMEHIGTDMTDDGEYVFHCYEVK